MSLNKPFHNSLCIITIFCLLIVGCSGKKKDNTPFPTITIKKNQLQPFLTFENDSIARPIDIAVLPNGNRAILDLELMSVLIFDINGKLQNSFGRRGKGPGEFVDPINIQTTGQFIYISDQRQLMRHKYTLAGRFVESIPAPEKSNGFYNTSVLANHEYLSPAEGQRGHLVVYRNTKTDSSFYFGEAMGDSTTTIALEENKRQAQNGEIADMFKNDILAAKSGPYYYVFLNAYGRLQKYDREGTLLWDKKLELPFMQAVFENYVETNKELQVATIRMLNYAMEMEVTHNHIYLLMGKSDKKEKAIIELDTDGDIQRQLNLNSIGPAIPAFEILADGDSLYLVDYSMGRILSLNLDTVDQNRY